MYRLSLRKRVEWAFAICGLWLSVIWGFAFFAAIRLSEDRVVTNQLMLAAENYPHLATNPRGYENVADLPEPLRAWAKTDPPDGLHEFVEEELHVAVIPAGNAQQRAFVVFDVAGIEAASSEDGWLLLAITGVVIVLGAAGFGLGIVVMRRAVEPVVQLAHVVSDIDMDNLSSDHHRVIDANRFGNDEVGVLADAIARTLERASKCVTRERYFTGWASHELRTPITVMTGALELLEESDLSTDDAQALDRMRRATADMTSTIEMFLWLARETGEGSYRAHFLVSPLVRKAVDQQQHVLNGKFIDVEMMGVAESQAYGHPQAFLTTLNNLVRNAFEQTCSGQGPIMVLMKERELLISNRMSRDALSTQTEAPSFHGYGLGLGIVQQLCERNGWSFSLQVDLERVTARLSW